MDRTRRVTCRLAALLAAALLASSGSGCSSAGRVDVRSDDEMVFFPRAQALVRFSGTESPQSPPPQGLWRPREGLEPGPAEMPLSTGLLGLEVDLAYGRGHDSQRLLPGEYAELGRRRLPGPGRLESDWDLWAASVAFRGGVLLAGQVSLEGLIGLGIEHVDLHLRGPTGRAHDGIFAAGPIVGAQASWHPLPWLGAYGRATGFGGIADEEGPVTTGVLEAGGEIQPLGPAAVIFGWRWLAWEQESSQSDLELEMSGPFVGLAVRF